MEAEIFIITIEQHQSAPLPPGAITIGGDATHVVVAVPHDRPSPHPELAEPVAEKGDE